MKRNLVLGLVSIFLLGWLASPHSTLFAQDAKKSDPKAMQVLGKMIEAMGGRSVLQAVKDMTASGTMEIVMQGMTGSATLYTKTPQKFRMDIEIVGMLITQAYDGEIGWFTNPQTGAVEELTGDQLVLMKRQALGDSVYLEPEKHGIVYTYQGQEKLEDTDYNVLRMVYPDGYEVTLYIDAKTHLVYMTKSLQPNTMTGAESEMESYTTDYREIEGMMAAFNITQHMDGEEFMIITLDEVKFNTGLDDGLFAKQ
jgi:outer membrane lipoprotein-sorting protein